MGEPISLGKATSLQPSPVKTAPSRPREPAGRGPADTADRSVFGIERPSCVHWGCSHIPERKKEMFLRRPTWAEWYLLSHDMGRVVFIISRYGQSDIYDLTFSMGYPVRPAGYMFCYNRSMIHLASVFSGGFFGREEEDFDLTQGDFCIMVGLPLLSGVVAPIHWRYRSRYQKWTFTGQNSCQRSVRKVSGSCQKSARSGETLL